MSNIQVNGNININGNGNVNCNMSGPMPFGALDNADRNSVCFNVSSNDVLSLPSAVAVNLDIGYSLLFGWILICRR
jgi:hypothetical protein